MFSGSFYRGYDGLRIRTVQLKGHDLLLYSLLYTASILADEDFVHLLPSEIHFKLV